MPVWPQNISVYKCDLNKEKLTQLPNTLWKSVNKYINFILNVNNPLFTIWKVRYRKECFTRKTHVNTPFKIYINANYCCVRNELWEINEVPSTFTGLVSQDMTLIGISRYIYVDLD